MNTSNRKQLVSREEAIDLLFFGRDIDNARRTIKDSGIKSFFDEYGNYTFPTDYVLDSPNQAYGMAGKF